MSNIDPATLYLHHTVNTHAYRDRKMHTVPRGLKHAHDLLHTLFLTVDLVNLRILWQNLVGQFLCGRQHLCVVDWYQILDKLLQLVSAHLEQSFWDRKVQFDLLGLPYSVKWQRHYMGTVEDVFVATGACYRCDFAAVKTDADAAYELRGWRRGRVRHCATQMETWKKVRIRNFIWMYICVFISPVNRKKIILI